MFHHGLMKGMGPEHRQRRRGPQSAIRALERKKCALFCWLLVNWVARCTSHCSRETMTMARRAHTKTKEESQEIANQGSNLVMGEPDRDRRQSCLYLVRH